MSAQGLDRRLGTFDAVVIGLGAMVGAGVFAAIGPAAGAAGSGLLIGLAVAAAIAYCNATASAQLAAQYPESGGTYVYGRERLGPWSGFTAGWCFVVGKTASCAAMALTFAGYLAPEDVWLRRGLALAAIAALTFVSCRGVTRTAGLTRILVTVTLIVLAIVVLLLLSADRVPVAELTGRLGEATPYGVLQSAGLLFFAFAGYARIATMGEEVRNPARTIPRAIPLALAIAVGVYLLVAGSALLAVGPGLLADSPAPLEAALTSSGSGWASPLVQVGATVASLGALLALLAGVGRTSLAMARNGDLPNVLAEVHPRYRVPARAQVAVGVVVAVLVSTTDLRGVIGFSSFGVLLYYAIANVSAFTQDTAHRRWPRTLNALGLLGCLTLVATLPLSAVLAGTVVVAVGLVARLLVTRARPHG
jgi:basic amino acid/polyamine antiporter, APA family